MSNQVELVSIEKHSKFVLEKILVNATVGQGKELAVKRKPTAKIEKLYCDPTKIISVIMPSGSESVFETDDEDEDQKTNSFRNYDDDQNSHLSKSTNASCKEITSSPGNVYNQKNDKNKSVIKEVVKPKGSSESDFKKEGGQYSYLLNEYVMSETIPSHSHILKPTRFEEYEEGACLLMPYAAYGDAEILSKWQFNNFKNIQFCSMELHKLRFMSQSYEYQQPHLQDRIESQCDQLEKYINHELIQKNLRGSVKVIRTLAKQISQALYFLHIKCDVAHNDIKPDNIYISQYNENKNQYNFKLADFGYAKKGNFQSNKEVLEFFNRKNKRYFSPELLQLLEGQSENIQAIEQKKCDVYAFGLSLYEILAGGFFPFKDDYNDPLFIKYLNKTITIQDFMQSFSQYFSQITDAHSMIDLLTHMMDPEPSNRYTITQVVQHPWLKSFKIVSKKSSSLLKNSNNTFNI